MDLPSILQVASVLLDVLQITQAGKELFKKASARRRLEELLRQAEEAFREEAEKQGLGAISQWVAMLPQQNRPLFRQALQTLLEKRDKEDLKAYWAESLPISPT